ncbi:MAG: hypothetical protein AB8F74_10425 [Saprospiraceae bacterium]
MNKLVPIILIVLGLGLGYFGFAKLEDSSASIEIADIEISAGDKGGQTQAYLMMGLGALLLGAGLVGAVKK